MAAQRHLLDVTRQFGSLNTEGERIAVWGGFDDRRFEDNRYSVDHDAGGRNNHFQGIGRVGKYLFLTGSFPYNKKRSDLFVLELGSRNADPGPWGSNLARTREPPDTDRLVAYYAIDQGYWHAGSFAFIDATLIVPLEGSGNDSVITFVDISDPTSPRRITGNDIHRPNSKAGVVAATCLPSGHVLVATWSDSDKPVNGNAPYHLDLYVSAATDSTSGLRLLGRYEPAVNDQFHRQFQGLDFLWERSVAGDRLFLIGFENTSPQQPHPRDPGHNRAYLFLVNLPAAWLQPGFDPAPVVAGPLTNVASFVDDHEFTPTGDWYNMDAGACAYVDSNQQLIVYSSYHYRTPFRGKTTDTLAVKCIEFRSVEFQAKVDRIDDAWAELYEGPGPAGRRLTVLGPWEWSIENTKQCYVDDRSFTAVSAVRFQIPEDRAYVLYPERAFQGEGAVVLRGTGTVGGGDLGALAPYVFGSCRFLPLSVATALPGAHVV